MSKIRLSYFLTPALLFIVGASALWAQSAPQTMTVAFDGSTVVVTGVTPHARMILFSLAHEWRDFHAETVRRSHVVVDDDGDGIVRWDLGIPMPRNSVWVACNLASGEYAAGTPQDMDYGRMPEGEVNLLRDGAGQLKGIRLGPRRVELLVIRAGVGAWTATLAQGTTSDEDGANNGKLLVGLSHLQAVDGGVVLSDHYEQNDLLVAIDDMTGQLITYRVGS